MPAQRRTLLVAPLLACAVAVPAFAQTGPALTNYAACTTKPSAQDSEAAHSAFLLGKRFFSEADYGSAIHNFVDAYKLDCTKTELLTFIARANELSGNKAEAVHALETYLDRAPDLAADDRSQIQKRIENLKAQMSAQNPQPVAVPVPPPTAPTTTAPPPPPPPPPAAGGHTAGPWVVTGIGGASLLAGGVIWLIGNGKYSTAVSDCPNHGLPCKSGVMDPTSVLNDGNTGRTMMFVGGGMFIGGAALAAAGLIWHFVEPTGAPAEPKKGSLDPVLAPGYVGVAGTF